MQKQNGWSRCLCYFTKRYPQIKAFLPNLQHSLSSSKCCDLNTQIRATLKQLDPILKKPVTQIHISFSISADYFNNSAKILLKFTIKQNIVSKKTKVPTDLDIFCIATWHFILPSKTRKVPSSVPSYTGEKWEKFNWFQKNIHGFTLAMAVFLWNFATLFTPSGF